MSEARTTLIAVVVASVLMIAAWATAPPAATPNAIDERGVSFFPQFRDPNAATSLEVVEFDRAAFVPKVLKITNSGGRWTIPSHYGYPSDAADQLSSLAAALIALKKDDVASENVTDHVRCGVVDPLDETMATSDGRGTRVTVRGTHDEVLADIILGAVLEGRKNLRYVRMPAQRRTYVAHVGPLAVSAEFGAWIERDLLQLQRYDIDALAIRSYVFDAARDNVRDGETLVLRRTDRDVWALAGLRAGHSIDSFRMNLLVTTLDDLAIVDVRPKPPGLAVALDRPGRVRISREDAADLEMKGFHTTTDGALIPSGAEVMVHTDTGVVFQLRFGDMVTDVTSSAQNRYLMISVAFDRSTSPTGVPPGDVERRLELLRARFSAWYYVVAEESFRNIPLVRKTLVRSG